MLSRFSYSSLGTFRNCPQQFKFEKIDKIKVPRRLYAFTHLGNAVHRQLKTAYQWAADGKLYPLETMLERYESDWEEPLKKKIIPAGEHLTVDDSIESGRKMLTTYFHRYQPFDQGILLGAEMTLNFELPGTRFAFTARFDRLLKREDGVVEICDYKTTRQLPAGGISSPGFKRQMGLYQLAVQAAYPQLEQIELAHYYLKHDEVISHRLRPDELDELTEQFRTDVLATIEAERLNDWPTKESGLCDFCDFAHLCPAKRHRLALDSEEGNEGRTDLEQAADLADRFIRVDRDLKAVKSEHEALKGEIKQTARGLDLSRLAGSEGDVRVSIRPIEKLPAKTRDHDGYAAVSALVRAWEMDTCLKLDETALMELYRKGRLSEEQAGQIKEYLRSEERVTITAKPNQPVTDEDDDSG